MRIEQRGKIKVFLCSCCNLPFAKLQSGRLVIQSKHHSDNHSNALDYQDLERILELMCKDGAIMPAVPTQ